MNGHDLIDVLAWFLRPWTTAKARSKASVAKRLLTCLSCEHVIGEPLIATLDKRLK
jgi:hypothetical protein